MGSRFGVIPSEQPLEGWGTSEYGSMKSAASGPTSSVTYSDIPSALLATKPQLQQYGDVPKAESFQYSDPPKESSEYGYLSKMQPKWYSRSFLGLNIFTSIMLAIVTGSAVYFVTLPETSRKRILDGVFVEYFDIVKYSLIGVTGVVTLGLWITAASSTVRAKLGIEYPVPVSLIVAQASLASACVAVFAIRELPWTRSWIPDV